MRWKQFCSAFLLFVLSFSCTQFAAAQSATDGAITGTVKDSKGARVATASVVIRSDSTNASLTTHTDESGSFRIAPLEPGTYTVIVSAPGFEAFQSDDLQVHVGQSTETEPLLYPGSVNTVVEVSGEAPAIETVSPDLASSVGQTVLDNVPVDNYRWSSYALLTPAVVSDADGYGLLSFRGQSTLLNNVTFDGADDNQAFFSEERGRTRAGYSTDKFSVREFQVNTSNYSVEYGRAAGGVVNAVTKSGTNRFHGQAYFFDRDAEWGAFNAFSTLPVETAPGQYSIAHYLPKDTRKQFGANLGGPILQERLFFFLSANRFQRVFPAVAIPTNSNVFYSAPDATLPVPSVCGGTAARGNAPPSTADANVCSMAEKLGTSYAAAYSGYESQFAGLVSMLGNAPRVGEQTIFFPRLDWQISGKNRASFEVNRLRWQSPAGVQTSSTVNYGIRSLGNDYVRDTFGIAKLNTMVSAALANQLRYQYSRDFESEYNQQPTAYEQSTLLRTNAGYSNPFGGIPPHVSITNAFQFGTPVTLNRPAYPDERRYQVADTLDYTRGAHSLKLGGDLLHTDDLSKNLQYAYGSYSYSNLGSYFADVLLSQNPATAAKANHYSSYEQGFGAIGYEFQTMDYSAFLQDQWKVNPRLHLNLGVRYEYEQLPNALLPNPAFPQTERLPSNKLNFAPRVGFAYDVLGSGKTVLRGGYGIFYARVINSTIASALVETGMLGSQAALSYNSGQAGAPVFPEVVTNLARSSQPPAVVYFDSNFKLPEIEQADLALERDLGWNTIASVSWMAAFGRRLPNFLDQNLPTPVTVDYTVQPDASGKSPLAPGTVLPVLFYGYPKALSGKVADNGRPDTRFSTITDIYSGVNSNYQALVLQLSHRLSHHVEFRTHYTYSQALDYGENNTTFSVANNVLDIRNLRAEYGPSNQDVRNRSVLTAVGDSPWRYRGFRGALFNDFQLSPTFQAQTGLPYSAGTSGSAGSSSEPVIAEDGTPYLPVGKSFNGSGGTARTPGIERNGFTRPGAYVLDGRVSKRFSMHERYKLELMMESFNALNHQNVTSVNQTAYLLSANKLTFNTAEVNGVVSPLFGTVTSTNNSSFLYSPRQIQLGAHLQF